jgi:cytochrome c2
LFRNRQTLFFVLVLLIITGVGVLVTAQGSPVDFFNTRQGFLVLMAAGIVTAIGALAVLGFVFAGIVNFIAAALAEEKAAAPHIGPAAARKTEGPTPPPGVPLYDNRQRALFYGLIALGVFLFLVVRALAAGVPPGYPLDRLPDLNNVFLSLAGVTVTEGVGFGLILGTALGAVIVLGVVLAMITARLGKASRAEEDKIKAAEKAAGPAPKAGPAARPVPTEKALAPAVPLTSNRALTIFYAVLIVGVFVFLLLRWRAAGVALGYIPAFNSELLRLPGEPIAGWPEFLPGPGLPLTELHAFALLLPVIIVAVIAAGIGLARLIAQFSATERTLAGAAPMWPAPQLAALEPRVKQTLATAIPKRLTSMDQFILVLLGAIVVLFLAWVVPGIFTIASTDQSVEATRVAALWTPTPQPGPTPTPGPGPDELAAQLPVGDIASGEALAVSQGCTACHIAAQPGATLVGPAWLAAQSTDGKGVADHAAERIAAAGYTGRATSAGAYLYESIVNPNAYVVPPYAPNIMPSTYSALEPQQLADLVAYLLQLR